MVPQNFVLFSSLMPYDDRTCEQQIKYSVL